MTRKSVKFPPGLRRGPWKTNITRRESDNKNIPSSIFISASNVQRWSNLKTKFRFGSDSELVDYLLTLGENQPKPSLSPDHESDDGWCPANQNGRKKRGPSLRAVLRRSNRKTGAKSDFVLDSIESEEFQSEDSEQSEGGTSQTRKFKENCLRNTTPNDSSNAPPKKRLDSLSGSKNFLNSDDEKEAKAHQLDAELALIVESVDLQPHKENESELYEFKDDSQDEQQISSGSPTVSCSNKSRVAHRRWKSYHKDKRKWKQSYAAVVTDEEEVMKPMQKDEESTSSEKDRRIFKALKKNRILTAYLDSQNKIADSISKDSCQSRVEDDKVSSKEQEDKPEQELSQPSSKKVLETDVVESDDTRSKEDVSEMPIFEKNDTSSGKENQSEVATLSEPIVVEVGERVKLKKRKKKTLHDSEETTTIIKEDNKNLNDSNTSELEKHSKQKRNWKKSLINYELEGQDSESKKMKTDVSSPSSISNISNIALEESHTEVLPNVSEIRTMREEKIKKESHNDSPKLVVPENELSDQDNDSALVSQCSQCCLRHVQQPCPVLNPLNVLEDSISFEQWQLQCQVQVRCSVIEAPRSKSGRLRKSASGSPSADAEKNNKDGEHLKTTESTRVYAEESLPYALGLQVINEEHGKSVVCRSSVAQFTQFGPLVGPQVHEKDISEESDMKHIWERSNEKHVKYLNTEDPQKSNWLRFIRPAPERHERNITLSVKDEQLYFISIVEIPEGSELLYWADDHISSWSKKKILKSSCGGCNMRFAHPLYYRTHCAVFHDPFHSLTIRKYHCKVCGEAVMGKENIMKHAADLHDGRGAYQCQYCHKFFLRLNYLEMHRTYGCSSNPHRTRPLCDFCGRYFCQPQKLKVHIKRMHSDMSEVLKEFQCKSCLKILGSRAALQRHFKEVHHRDVVVASSCDRCGKSFQNRSNLKIHMLTHSGVKPFRCQQEGCSAAFTTKQCLQFHYKKAHGLSEDALPRIERSIAYTFDAYAGETADGNIVAHKDQMKKPTKLLRKSRKSSTKKTRSQVLQPEGTENRQELMEPVVPVEPIVPEVTECSEPDPVCIIFTESLHILRFYFFFCLTMVCNFNALGEPYSGVRSIHCCC
ncbi:hypothetical protein ONE63_000518 [Megalurothrips usitatus]|uniref:C2H2-type domain-containing protein n=1 Tax=Megalurothrips usitatus TaxID=439358 RepID=A0AAV7XYP5_9NEOP|nr:hypothetical protein ONE63_000518 [Megalurothrips usitatus]